MTAVSTLPILCTGLAAFWIWLGLRSFNRGHIGMAGLISIAVWIAALAAWGFVTARWSLDGTYTGARFYALMPGLWWPMIPAFVTVALLALPVFRNTLYAVVSQNSRQMVLIHALRIAAIGGVLKGLNGLLPPSFALTVGIPDLLFGLSALVIGLFWTRPGLPTRTLIAWNLAGLAVIMPAPVLMQLGLPGPFHTFTGIPDARALFEYPMVLAPTLVVPVFITMNAIHAVVLWMEAQPDQGTPELQPPP